MRGKVWLATALVIGAGLAIPATSAAQVPTQDSAVGSGAAGGNFPRFDFSATSDPIGGSPSGTASWEQFGVLHFEGTVSCLAVNGNRAVIGIDIDQAASSLSFAGFFLTVVDGGPAGSGDNIDAAPTSFSVGDIVPTACSQVPPAFVPSAVTSGDITVIDAPPLPTSKEQCKNGGWRSFGVFKNQGDCVSFVATGGKNPPAGP
jgi:hypothetical protein